VLLGHRTPLPQIPGVVATAVGYTGGEKQNPTYEEVCSKKTGHAEAILIEFNPKKVSYERLLDYFWDYHNPTTLNRQGPDVGSQYRSAVFFHSPQQETVVKASMRKAQARFRKPIVTEVVPAAPFWMAETYHQQYHIKTGTAACPIDRG
jgi:peptide-methionine (S)-S-oxide reductase